jgi:hypothetical protein
MDFPVPSIKHCQKKRMQISDDKTIFKATIFTSAIK